MMSEEHVNLSGSLRAAKPDARRLRDADPNARVEVTLDLRHPALPDPSRVSGRRMTYQELASNFSASRADADTVARVLSRYGIRVEQEQLDTWSIRVSGTVAQMEAAFQPRLGIYYNAEQGEFRGRESTLRIPAELDGIVKAVLGFDQRRVARRAAARKATPAPLPPLAPADIEARYQFPAGDGSGQNIAIAEFGGGYFASDVAAYCGKYGRPTPTVNAIAVNAPALTLAQIEALPPQQQQVALDESGEVMMDVELVAGLCPRATINVYFATFDQQGWTALLNRVIQSNPTPVTLSVSWGSAEDGPDWAAGAIAAIDGRMQALAAMGITVCVASGDDGSGDGMTDGRAHVDFPSVSTNVLAVGGTMLTGTAQTPVEQAWWQSPGRRTPRGTGATGGGVSVMFARPTYQSVQIKSVNTGAIDGRIVPDIAAIAGPPMYDLILMGEDQPNGGTSASTPLWAALIARTNALLPASKQQRFLTPMLYQPGPGGTVGQTVCTDITQGQNASHPQPGIGYSAGLGYDAVSGWGVPNGAKLLDALSSI
ncbi:MAG: protease pro-enzyme activation domain-containing protein [Capsulimonadaceae bacterium]